MRHRRVFKNAYVQVSDRPRVVTTVVYGGEIDPIFNMPMDVIGFKKSYFRNGQIRRKYKETYKAVS